jgi:two-component system response regulator DegU
MLNTANLTIREIEILRLVALGYMNKQIAADFDISEQTAKNHITRILRKLDAVNRTEAVVKAARCGLVSLDPWATD